MLVDFEFSELYKFSDWPNRSIPKVTAGVYAIWHDDESPATLFGG